MDRRLRRDVVWNLVPIALLGVVGLGLNFLIAKWWGAPALGVFNLVTIAYFVFAVVGAWGIQYSALRSVAERPDDRDHVAATVVGALVPNIVLAAISTLAFLALRPVFAALHGSDEVGQGMSWAALGLFCFAINKVLFGVVNGLRRMRAFAVYTSLRYVLIAVGVLIARAADVSRAQLGGIWTFVEATMLLVLLVELLATVRIRRCVGWTRWARTHLAYGARGVTATLAYEINTKLDVWMLGAAGVSTGQVGIYSLAAGLNEGATQLSVVVQNNVNPIIARSLADGRPGEVEALVKRTRRWFVPALAGACVFGAIIYPRVIPWVIGDHSFHAATWPFAILMAGLALASPYLPFSQMLLMADRPAWHTVFMLLVVAVNFIANLALIPLWGLSGAAAAMALAVISAAILIRAFSRSRAGVRL
ncbi:MAG: oligosaccharide flippase family protein [Kofleriaceae bacterium]|nr:oligosaccharide flippase family protein [Kofleriaceae bacterium]